MRLPFGFEIRKSQTLSPVDGRGGWFPIIREPYGGAWQNNDEWRMDTVLAYPPVYSCISLISSDIAKLTPMVMRETKDGIYVQNKSSDLLSVLRKPNSYQNHIQFKEWWMLSKLIRGNTYILKGRDNRGIVTRLYIIDPEKVSVLVTNSGDVYYQLNASELAGIQQAVTVPASEIIHDRMNCLFHPLVGVSPLYACGTAANAGASIISDSKKFFENGAKPGGGLTAPGSISDETAARLKAYFESNFTGANSGKIMVMGDGLKFEPFRMTAVDAQLIDQIKWTAESVCSAYHVPAYKVGFGTMPTHNNIEALTQDYYTQCLQRHIEDMEIALDYGLGVSSGECIELDLSGLFRMDAKTQLETIKIGIDASVFTPNNGRAKLNLPPIEGGDTVYMQQQNYSLAALAKRDSKNPLSTESTTPEDGMTEDAATSVQETALNGAQIASLNEIIILVSQGKLPADSAAAVIAAAFPTLSTEGINAMLDPLKKFEPEEPEPEDIEAPEDDMKQFMAEIIKGFEIEI
jgi:HK97 family phage portal protein